MSQHEKKPEKKPVEDPCSRCGGELHTGSFHRKACQKCDPSSFDRCYKCRQPRIDCCC